MSLVFRLNIECPDDEGLLYRAPASDLMNDGKVSDLMNDCKVGDLMNNCKVKLGHLYFKRATLKCSDLT